MKFQVPSIFKKQKRKKQANISGNLGAFQELVCDASFLQKYKAKPTLPTKSSSDLQKDLDTLKSIPTSPQFPKQIKEQSIPEQLISDIAASLKKETSLAAITDTIKKKITKHYEFFEMGVEIHKHDPSTCPFCEQETISGKPKEIIETYIKYFQDAEAEHKKELKKYRDALKDIEKNIKEIKTSGIEQESLYDKINRHIPSRDGIKIELADAPIKAILNEIKKIEGKIDDKEEDLARQISVDKECSRVFIFHYDSLNKVIANNNNKLSDLKNEYENLYNERRSIQGHICKAFEIEFAIKYHDKINEWHQKGGEIHTIGTEITILEGKQPTISARERTEKTFQKLLKFFFKNKYTFLKDEFVIIRGTYDIMSRGADKTLSDGEKTIIAFCWFIASIHLKVKHIEDYKKVFLVFDDPITSLSYDYIFSMADILKNLKVSSAGDVYVDPQDNAERLRTLILTHSDSFFNTCLFNSVVEKDACFALEANNSDHKISKMSADYIIPFQQQLKHIYMVSTEAKDPEFYTCNSIRSTLEFFFRICKPDKAKTPALMAENIREYCGGDMNFTLLNMLSHGSHVDCNSKDDIIQACKDTIKVIRGLAPGQITLLDNNVSGEGD